MVSLLNLLSLVVRILFLKIFIALVAMLLMSTSTTILAVVVSFGVKFVTTILIVKIALIILLSYIALIVAVLFSWRKVANYLIYISVETKTAPITLMLFLLCRKMIYKNTN